MLAPGLDHPVQLLEALVEQRVARAERLDLVDERAVVGPDLGEGEAGVGLRRRATDGVEEDPANPPRADLAQLVDGTQHRHRVVDADAAVEALGDPTVVDLHRHGRDRQPGQRIGHDQRKLDLVVERQGVAVDDVDVGLQELAVATLLRALTPPRLLDLVAPEREVQLAGVLQHVPGERHGQVEVQAKTAVGVVLRLQPPQQVDLLVGLALAQQLVERLDRPGLDRREAVQLEDVTHGIDDVLLDQTFARQPFGKAGHRRRTGHQVTGHG